jgi:3',5'-cyclic-AMP phosphodiesterase
VVRFVVFGDTKGKEDGINKRVLKKILNQAGKLDKKPDFFVSMGDSIAGSTDTAVHKNQMEGFKGLVHSYFPNALILPVTGNHEVNNEPVDDTYEKLIRDTYICFKQHGSLESYNNTAYYMDLEYCRFIILNCYHYGELKKVSGEQLSWLERVLAADKKYKIVFIHCPLFPTGAHTGTCLDEFPMQRDKLWEAIEKNNTAVIFTGHEHNYSRRILEGASSKVQQVVAGGGGEKLKGTFKSKRGVVVPPKAVYHFVVVDMDAEGIKIKSISIEGKTIDEFEIIK